MFVKKMKKKQLFENRILRKIASSLNDPKMTMKGTRPKVPHVC